MDPNRRAVGAQILSTSTARTRVIFSEEGIYRFELRASDGALSSIDTTAVSVGQGLPFTVTAPADNAQIVIGRPYVVRWQMDPSIPCTVLYSIDNGITWVQINTWGAEKDSLVWDVDSLFEPNTAGIIKVHEYQNAPNSAQGTFLLVDTLMSHARMPDFAYDKAQPNIFIDRRGIVYVSGYPAIGDARMLMLDAQGRCVSDAHTGSRISCFSRGKSECSSILLYNIILDKEVKKAGRILMLPR